MMGAFLPARILATGLALAAAGLLAASEPGPNGHVLIVVPAGEWSVGEEGHPLNPLRKVRLAAYRLAEAETTNAQFAAFVRATGYVTEAEKRGFGLVFRAGLADWEWLEVRGAHWRRPHGPEGPSAEELPEHPVTQISGADAQAYCRWLGGRLPKLDEWEVAARAGATGRWPWGDQFVPGRANIWNGATHAAEAAGDGYTLTAPVRSFAPNTWGFYDVIGNVFEYCADLPPPLREGEGVIIAARGGSWWCSRGTCNFYNLVDIGRMVRDGSLSNHGFRIAFGGRRSRLRR